MKILKNKKTLIILSVFLLVISFLIYSRVANAANNDVQIQNAEITNIITGSGTFTPDNIVYKADNVTIDSWTPGGDSSAYNRLVRTFDTITYNISTSIIGKDGTNYQEDRTIEFIVTLSDEEAKYVTFGPNEVPGQKTNTYKIDHVNANSLNDVSKNITLYVLGAPNGFEIKPQFEIKESTDRDSNTHAFLGLKGNKYNYSYNYETGYSNQANFDGYMPTIVSARTANVSLEILPQTSEGQKTTYNGEVGRYATYVLGFKIKGDAKGQTMPVGDINFTPNFTSSNGATIVNEIPWNRLYGPEVVNYISPVLVAAPYSSGNFTDSYKNKYPGAITLSNGSGKISDYNITYSSPKNNANSTVVQNGDHYIGTYAISVFSPRKKEDGRNSIFATMAINNANAVDTAGNPVIFDITSPKSIENKYYESVDYSLTGEFYDTNENKLAVTNRKGTGSASKGTTVIYKTIFNYKKTMSDQGLKEVIKFDTNALRVVPNGEKEIKITVESDSGKLSQSDFEVKYVSGSFDNSNYHAVNYNDGTMNSRINSEDINNLKTSCSTVNTNLNSYNINQVQNLYGGPCIEANENVEQSFDSIYSAKTDKNQEIPITKVIVQTKEGVSLPDDAIVTIEVGVRVRNVGDLSQSYQATVVATSSDYDSNLTYYAPRIAMDNMKNSITNPDNYEKTVYVYNTASSIDTDSPWGDSIKVVNFTARQTITVTNKDENGKIKTKYNSNSGETINYNIKTTISDNNEAVGADDVWYINYLKVEVDLPEGLNYVEDTDLGTPYVSDNGRKLIYMLPYTKPNQKIKDIDFKVNLSPKIKGSKVELTVRSTVEAININGESDLSYIGSTSSSFTIYVNGITNVIVSQKLGPEGSVIDKDGTFSYLLDAYNNTEMNVNNYVIMDVFPYNGDSDGSSFSGSYEVNVMLPTTLATTAKVYCSTKDPKAITNSIDNDNNEFEECVFKDAEDYKKITAIKITDITVPIIDYMGEIKITVKTKGNTYSDKYFNSFIGGSETLSTNKSNVLKTRVISRNISGRVFVDMDEDGIEEEGDKYLNNIPVTLYKLNEDGSMKDVAETTTNENGEYKFKNLNKGRYKIRATYNSELYDVTLRYATEDLEHDSDAYKIGTNTIEIGSKYIPSKEEIKTNQIIHNGIDLYDVETITDMNIGLISRKSFGFDISKYITKVDLAYNNGLTTYNYDNQTKVALSVKNSARATARIYYGIKIENNSTKAGYVKLINEDIPAGLNFDLSDPINEGWYFNEGSLQSVALEKDLIHPGEVRYLTVVLDMPTQSEAKSFLNTVTLLDIEEYDPKLTPDEKYESRDYVFGETVKFAGVTWHVINASEKDSEGNQNLTLLANSVSNKAHGSESSIYKWSESIINGYINSTWLKDTTLDIGVLYDNKICDDASGLEYSINKDGNNNPIGAGGTLFGQAICQSNVYTTSRIRLLTEQEYITTLNTLKTTNAGDQSWLRNNNIWLMNSVYEVVNHDAYGRPTNSAHNKARYASGETILNAKINSSYSVRPVITISSKNIIPE